MKEQDFAVINYLTGASQAIADAPTQGIKMEVGIEDCLHIEFEFDKQKYHLQVRYQHSHILIVSVSNLIDYFSFRM